MKRAISRMLDLREGEAPVAIRVFAVLFLIVSGYTMIETARDALFLAHLPARALNLVYIVLAGVSFAVAAGASALSARAGARTTLLVALVAASVVAVVFWWLPPSRPVVFSLYLVSGLTGTTLTVQFWTLCAHLFSVSQGRRIFGPIASGGVAGALTGASAGAAVVTRAPVSALLVMAAVSFLGAAIVTLTLRADDDRPPVLPPRESGPPRGVRGFDVSMFRANPFLLRIAALVATSTAALLTLDYAFKVGASRTIPAAHLGSFFARYYVVTNGIALLAQVFLSARVIRRFGVVGTASVMPFLLVFGGLASAVSGGSFLLTSLLKGVDGSFRYSLNRVAIEILYLPLPVQVRDRGKSFLDSVLGRVVQAVTAASLLTLAAFHLAKPPVLAFVLVGLCVLWWLVALGLRRPYLDLFRRALAAGSFAPMASAGELDLTSAEALVEALASTDSRQVVAAIDFLDLRRRGRLVPALVLYHDDPLVLVRALDLFGRTAREDWTALGQRLLEHGDDAVRIAAVRALAKHGVKAGLSRALSDKSATVRAYAAFHVAAAETQDDIAAHPLVADILRATGGAGDEGRLGLLEAIIDTPDARSTTTLVAVLERRRAESGDHEASRAELALVRGVAEAIGKIKDERFIAHGIGRLSVRDGRDSVRKALVAIGDPALEQLEAALVAAHTPRRVRLHVPRAIAEFQSQRAYERLALALESESDGHLRYRVLRAVGHLVSIAPVRVNRARMEIVARANLVEHLRLLALRVALAQPDGHDRREETRSSTASYGLLVDLLDDKARQALERAFRLLQIAHKAEDLRSVHAALFHGGKAARENAAEFVDTLLWRADERSIRELVRTVVDDLSPEQRVARSRSYLREAPKDFGHALEHLLSERDDALAAIAAEFALTLEKPHLRELVARARERRPALRAECQRLFGGTTVVAAVDAG